MLADFDYEIGTFPWAGLVLNAAGRFFGTATQGGDMQCGGSGEGCGAVFKLTSNPDRMYPIHKFKGPDGAYPHAGLIVDAAGNLYGTTSGGGAYGMGTVFKLTPPYPWTFSKLHTFKGSDGAYPYAGLIFDTHGNLYGTTLSGGAYGAGTVFKLTPQPDGHWKLTRLHSFRGHHPYADLVIDAAGNLYGTTTGGGLGYGVVFKITP